MSPRLGGDEHRCGSFQSMGYESDDFKPVKRLGYGDMGTVFLATLRKTRRPFAMKVMNKEVVKARQNGYRAQRELEILSVLDHPFVPHLFTHFESKKNMYLIMDYCCGGDMNMLRQRQPEKRFSENAARFYAAEVLLAIEYLHKMGIIYRDLKPENVLIQEDGHIMLTDFDLSLRIEKQRPTAATQDVKAAKSLKRSGSKKLLFMCGNSKSLDVVCATQRDVDVKPSHRKTKKIFPSEMKGKRGSNQAGSVVPQVKSQSFVGTEEYVAPEMVLGAGHGMSLDWWTFGIFLYEMVYGTTPFKGKNRRETFYNILSRQPSFPGAWTPARDLISKLLVKDPSKRLGSVGGAEEIKSHIFFEGMDWDSIQHVSRPPWVPQPLVLEGVDDKELAIDELLKQTVAPLNAREKENPESNGVTDGTRSSCSSTISDNFSDSESCRGGYRRGGGAGTGCDSFSEF